MKKGTSSVSDPGTPNGNRSAGPSADQLTEKNVETVTRLEEAAREKRTPTDRLAEKIASFCGSMTFVWIHVVWFGSWLVFNSIPGIPHIDPFPFTLLTLMVSLEAIFLSTFILISQNLDKRISERRSHLDLQLNLLSEQENTKMIIMLHAIAAKVGADLTHDPQLKALSEETQPQRLIEQIEARENN
ncbi:MAG TPA: DUF1003 domain-containing protein [Pyrinomonadaceae bacterium]|nr:DUF1003 domain-containing protein [Pyrinomonadaceae bacterium]